MINFCLNNEEIDLLKDLVGKRLIKIKHDPLDKFGKETVYGRVELFFEDSVVSLDYDYQPYCLFGSQDDDRPKFSIKNINEDEAVSALQNTTQICVNCDKTIKGITLVEDCSSLEWNGKKDEARVLVAIVFKFDHEEMAIQGDYMMPLLDIIKGEKTNSLLVNPGDEYKGDSSTKSITKRFEIDL